MTGRVPFRSGSGLIGLAIAGNPENDGHLPPWQEAVGHEIIPDAHKNGCANETTDWPRARALREAVSGRRVRLTGTPEDKLLQRTLGIGFNNVLDAFHGLARGPWPFGFLSMSAPPPPRQRFS
jgi:hypothetical protein